MDSFFFQVPKSEVLKLHRGALVLRRDTLHLRTEGRREALLLTILRIELWIPHSFYLQDLSERRKGSHSFAALKPDFQPGIIITCYRLATAPIKKNCKCAAD